MKAKWMKALAAGLCGALILSTVSACGSTAPESKTESAASEMSEKQEEQNPETEPNQQDPESGEEVKEKEPGHYTFQTHVSSSVMNEIMGQEWYDTYCNLVDAVLAGETSFACPDQDTYDWVMGQYAYRLFPVIAEYVIYPEDGNLYSDGRGYFSYKIPYEEFQVKLQEFEDLTVGILNEALEDDYSDVEKALALYQYFTEHYTYDYEVYEKMKTEYQENITAYRLLTEKTGICQEIATAYSYLLLQAGVDATTVSGISSYDGQAHQWSYVTIGGKYYHIDATYALGYEDTLLTYFMMTDEKRYVEDAYDSENWVFSSTYAQGHDDGDRSATDDYYLPVWGSYLEYMDTKNNRIGYRNEEGEISYLEYEDVYGSR